VVFTDFSAHNIWVNSLALQLAGIDNTTPDPPGGVIVRDANGNPTGVLREFSATGLVFVVHFRTCRIEAITANENYEREWHNQPTEDGSGQIIF
jgi:predicted amidohydrolase YtcJ